METKVTSNNKQDHLFRIIAKIYFENEENKEDYFKPIFYFEYEHKISADKAKRQERVLNNHNWKEKKAKNHIFENLEAA